MSENDTKKTIVDETTANAQAQPASGETDIPEDERQYFILDCLFNVPMASRFLVWSRSQDDLEANVLPHYKSLKELQDLSLAPISREQAKAIKEEGANSRDFVPSPYTSAVDGSDSSPSVQ